MALKEHLVHSRKNPKVPVYLKRSAVGGDKSAFPSSRPLALPVLVAGTREVGGPHRKYTESAIHFFLIRRHESEGSRV